MTASALEISNNSLVGVFKPMIYLIRLATSLSSGPCITVNCESWVRAKRTFDKSKLWHFEYCRLLFRVISPRFKVVSPNC